jgi:hypothetical protein
MPELRVRSLLDHNRPSELPERPNDFPAGNPRQWRHEVNLGAPSDNRTATVTTVILSSSADPYTEGWAYQQFSVL